IQHGADGFPVRESALSVLGNPNPDWTSGINNTLMFGNITMNALIDISMGGEMYSATNAYAYYFGLHKDTLEGRDQGNNFKAPGSNVAMNAQTYYQKFYNNYTEQFVYDASYVKLRSFSLGYRIPASMLSKTPIRGAEVQLVGRNLLLLYSNVPNIDPESSYSVGGSYGLEMYGVPQTRSLGFNVNLRF
ncbi:MAG TPA: SusC/RagA family TonB-linked outer membrane protein, partial [Rhodothermales bacterium]|nr:SusC/RagA family TonB-linked outer membrane protein [Rhodothermales bacterium]